MRVIWWAAALTAFCGGAAGAQLERQARSSSKFLDVSQVQYRGNRAVRVVDKAGDARDPLVLLPVTDFHNGVIEAEVAGLLGPKADEASRGFIGIAFRVQNDPSRYEAFYIRPTNGRSEDQVRRNHSTQYISQPEYTWSRLRKESPGEYESYADMAAGQWVRLRIEVNGAQARLYVGGASQPTLLVNDLKLGSEARGGVALWIGNGTDGYFRNVRVMPAGRR